MFNPSTLAQNADTATSVESVTRHGEWIAEIKLDGIRLLAHVGADRVRTYTRSGKEQTGKLPAIEAELLANFPAGTWLDGEIVAFRIREDESVEHHWGTAQSVMGSGTDRAARASGAVTYSVFDVMALGGIDARPAPFSGRRGLLERVFDDGAFKAVVMTPQIAAIPEALDTALAAGFEGLMLKNLNAPYVSGRSKNWVKLKGTQTEDVIITALPHDGEGKYQGQVGAVVFSQIVDNSLVEMGRCSGMDDATRRDLTLHPERWLGTVLEVKRYGVMPTGGWRHPTWLRPRTDKEALECVAS